MDRLRNPYTPNAGARPPELAGRESVLHDFEFLLDRIADGRTEKGLIITGLRGVGKTVLLSEFEALAQQRNMVVVRYEAAKADGDFERKLATLARRALLSISPQDRWRDKAKHAAGVLGGFKAQWDPEGRWTLAYEGPSVAGLADSGDLVSDLPDLMCAVGEAARDHGRALVLLLDEIQYLRSEELSALVMNLRRAHVHVARARPTTNRCRKARARGSCGVRGRILRRSSSQHHHRLHRGLPVLPAGIWQGHMECRCDESHNRCRCPSGPASGGGGARSRLLRVARRLPARSGTRLCKGARLARAGGCRREARPPARSRVGIEARPAAHPSGAPQRRALRPSGG